MYTPEYNASNKVNSVPPLSLDNHNFAIPRGGAATILQFFGGDRVHIAPQILMILVRN